MPRLPIKKIKSTIPIPRNLTNRERLIYKDSGGNRLYAKKGTRGEDAQFSAKNQDNRYVNLKGVQLLMRSWSRSRKR